MSTTSSLDPQYSINLAKAVAYNHFNKNIEYCRLHDEQGLFSKTYVVRFKDQSAVVVQFRDNPLDLSLYKMARRTSFFAKYTIS